MTTQTMHDVEEMTVKEGRAVAQTGCKFCEEQLTLAEKLGLKVLVRKDTWDVVGVVAGTEGEA